MAEVAEQNQMPVEVIELSETSLFRNLDQGELRVLAAHFVSRTVRAGTVLFRMGDPGESCFILRGGAVELSVRDHGGEKLVLTVLQPGEIFGEISLLDNGPRTATATVAKDAEILELSRAELTQFLMTNPAAAIDLLSVLGGRLRKTDEQLRARVARNPNNEIEHEFTIGQKIAWKITEASGSFAFLVVNILFFGIWILINTNVIPSISAFDPYPFGFLTMAVSLEAIVLSIAVLLAQNLQAARDHVRGEIEYEVNVQAELEISHLHVKVDELHGEVLGRLERLETLLDPRRKLNN